MLSTYRLQTVLVVILLAFGLTACSNPDEEFIQGRWQRGNVHFVDEWYFDRGTFSHQSAIAIYQPQVQSGRYSIVESQEDSLTLELFDLGGSFPDESQQVRITIDREAGTLKIGRETYTRVAP